MPIEIKADARDGGTHLEHFWSVCVGAGRAAEGLRAGWLEQMEKVVDYCGFRYVRFHGLFHDDMFVYREVDGVGVFNFQYIDELFDRLLEIGIRPFVEFGFCPGDLATETGTVFWWKGNGSPPKDYAKWGELIHRVTAHWVERYGLEEVQEWYFEVWNEPNLHPFFKGTRTQYFELYKVSALAVKSVHGSLRVGGPSTSNFVPDARFDGDLEDTTCHATVTQAKDLDALEWRPVWLAAFLEYCQQEELPLDFISCHPYPTDWALDALGSGSNYTRGADSTRKDLALLRKMVDASPYPHAEIHLTEWSSSPSPRDHSHDHLPAAAYVIRANVESAGLVDSLSYWVFTDIFEESGGGNTIYHGGFGMINFQGVVKPTFHAYRFLDALGDETLRTSPGGIVTRESDTGKLTALAWHYPPEIIQAIPASFNRPDRAIEVENTGTPDRLRLELTGLPPSAPVVIETLGKQAGHGRSAWVALGSPAHPTREQMQIIQRAAETTRQETLTADSEGRLLLDREIEPWNVVLVREL